MVGRTDDHPLGVLVVVEDGSYTYDTRVRALAASLDRAGFRVAVICPRFPGDPPTRRQGRIDVRFFPRPSFPSGAAGHILEYAWSFLLIAAIVGWRLLRRRFDIVHICNPPDVLFPIGLCCRLLGIPFVYDQHDRCPELYKVRYGAARGLLLRLLVACERLSLRTATHVFTTNETARRSAIARSGIAPERVTVVRNGPNLDEVRSVAASEVPFRDAIRIGYLGNMNPQDGVETIVWMARHLRDVAPHRDFRYVLVGDGPSLRGVRKLTARLGLADAIDLVGRTSHDEALRRMASCDVCLQPDPKNPFTDGCTMVKTLEYMAIGKPVVAFPLEETVECCGDAALYARGSRPEDLAAEVLRLAESPVLRGKLGQEGRARVEDRFHWSLSEASLLGVYMSLAGRPSAMHGAQADGLGRALGRDDSASAA